MEKDEIRRLLEAKMEALPEALGIAFMLRALEQLDQAFAFDGERCDRIVAKVLQRIASGTQTGVSCIQCGHSNDRKETT